MYTVKYGGEIHKGDLIAVSNGNYISVGIYYGRGRGGTFQYFYPGQATSAKDHYDKNVLRLGVNKVGLFKIAKIWKSYINAPTDTRIIKLNRDNITDVETIEFLLTDKEILKQFNIEVNY